MARTTRDYSIVDEINADLQNWAYFFRSRHLKGEAVTSNHYWRNAPQPAGPPRDRRLAELYEAALCELKQYPRTDDRYRYWQIAKYEYLFRWPAPEIFKKFGVSRATYYRDRQSCFSWLDGRVNKKPVDLHPV